jgi:hypothetical protein
MRILKRGASREPQLDACPRCGALPRGSAVVAEAFGSACPMCGLTLHDVHHRARAGAGGWAPRKRRASSAGWPLRLRVWANASALDALLGQGLPATDSPELTLRAHQLASDGTQLALSMALTRLVDGAARHDGARVASMPHGRGDGRRPRQAFAERCWRRFKSGGSGTLIGAKSTMSTLLTLSTMGATVGA